MRKACHIAAAMLLTLSLLLFGKGLSFVVCAHSHTVRIELGADSQKCPVDDDSLVQRQCMSHYFMDNISAGNNDAASLVPELPTAAEICLQYTPRPLALYAEPHGALAADPPPCRRPSQAVLNCFII